MNDCNLCFNKDKCANDASDEIMMQYYHQFEMEVYDIVDDEDVEYYAQCVRGCVGYRSPFLEQDIRSIIIMRTTYGLVELWVSDVRDPGSDTVFYLMET